MPFTPQEISQIIEEFLATVGSRQYIGARYVPIFGRKGEASIAWDNSAPYEPLTIVLDSGNSYTSRQYVPAGIDITDTDYWAETGSYNAQIEAYRTEVLGFDSRIDALEDALPIADYSALSTVKDAIDGVGGTLGLVTNYLDDCLPATAFDSGRTVQWAIANDATIPDDTTIMIHVDGTTGSDTNDGAPATPLKTIARAFELYRDNNWRDLRIYIDAAGTYPLGINRITNAQVHIVATTGNVTLYAPQLRVYNSYLHIEGFDLDDQITFDVADYHQDIGALYFNYVKFRMRRFYNSWCGITMYQSFITLDYPSNQAQTHCFFAIGNSEFKLASTTPNTAYLRIMGGTTRVTGTNNLMDEGNNRTGPIFYVDGCIFDMASGGSFASRDGFTLNSAIVHLEHALGFATPTAQTTAEGFSSGLFSGRGAYDTTGSLVNLGSL